MVSREGIIGGGRGYWFVFVRLFFVMTNLSNTKIGKRRNNSTFDKMEPIGRIE